MKYTTDDLMNWMCTEHISFETYYNYILEWMHDQCEAKTGDLRNVHNFMGQFTADALERLLNDYYERFGLEYSEL